MPLPPTRSASSRRCASALAGAPGTAWPVAAQARAAARIAPGDELRHDEVRVAALAESELAALAVGDLAAGGRHHRAARRDVPFASGSEAGIDVGAAFRDPAEFHRRAERRPDRVGPAVDEASVLGSPCERLTAAIQGSPASAAGPGADRLGAPMLRRRQTHPLGAAADDAAPEQAERGRADDAEQRHALRHQREVDGELVAAGDELLGAVERVDQEEAVREMAASPAATAPPTASGCRREPRQACRR